MEEGQLRIGELSRRVGVSPELLRAWERRYGLLQPSRTDGGFRLYSAGDVARIERMQQLLTEGLTASEAARVVGAETPDAPERPGGAAPLTQLAADLTRALDAFDEVQAHGVLDRLLAGFQLEAVLSEVLLPYLRELGERWARGEATVAQEHFASNLIRVRLLALGQGWDRGRGRRAMLACPPDEQHDLPLAMYGLALRRYGWRITFLGADTPVETLGSAAEALRPDLIVLAATVAACFEGVAPGVADLAARWPVALAGRGASQELAQRLSARLLEGDPVTVAAEIATAS